MRRRVLAAMVAILASGCLNGTLGTQVRDFPPGRVRMDLDSTLDNYWTAEGLGVPRVAVADDRVALVWSGVLPGGAGGRIDVWAKDSGTWLRAATTAFSLDGRHLVLDPLFVASHLVLAVGTAETVDGRQLVPFELVEDALTRLPEIAVGGAWQAELRGTPLALGKGMVAWHEGPAYGQQGNATIRTRHFIHDAWLDAGSFSLPRQEYNAVNLAFGEARLFIGLPREAVTTRVCSGTVDRAGNYTSVTYCNAGQVWVYRYEARTWVRSAIVESPVPEFNGFGTEIAAHGDLFLSATQWHGPSMETRLGAYRFAPQGGWSNLGAVGADGAELHMASGNPMGQSAWLDGATIRRDDWVCSPCAQEHYVVRADLDDANRAVELAIAPDGRLIAAGEVGAWSTGFWEHDFDCWYHHQTSQDCPDGADGLRFWLPAAQ